MTMSKKKLNIRYGVIIIATIAITIFWLVGNYIFSADEFREARLYQSIILVSINAIGAVYFLYLAQLYKIKTYVGKIMLWIGVGLLCWTIGEAIYAYYEVFTDIDPFPSIADLFWLVGYLPLSFGLILQMRLTKVTLTKNEKIYITVLYIAICILVIIVSIIYPILDEFPIPEDEILAYIISAIYPIFDLVLILCVLVVYVKLRRGQLNTAWILLLLASIVLVVADILYAWVQIIYEAEQVFEPFDLLYNISYILFIASALTFHYIYYEK